MEEGVVGTRCGETKARTEQVCRCDGAGGGHLKGWLRFTVLPLWDGKRVETRRWIQATCSLPSLGETTDRRPQTTNHSTNHLQPQSIDETKQSDLSHWMQPMWRNDVFTKTLPLVELSLSTFPSKERPRECLIQRYKTKRDRLVAARGTAFSAGQGYKYLGTLTV